MLSLGLASVLRLNRPTTTSTRREPRTLAAFVLRAGELQPVNHLHAGAAVYCRRGTLWVTQAGDAADHVLREGERFAPAPTGGVVVQALEDAAVEVR